MRVNLTLYTSKAEYMNGAATQDHRNIPADMIGVYVDRFMERYSLKDWDMVSHVEIVGGSTMDERRAEQAAIDNAAEATDAQHRIAGMTDLMVPPESIGDLPDTTPPESMVEGLRRVKGRLVDEGDLP